VHGVVNAAHPMARVTQARKRHPVDPEGGVVVDHHRRCIELAIAMGRRVEVAGKDRRLKRHIKAVGLLDRLVNVAIGVDADHRAKHLVGADPRLGRGIIQHGWRVAGLAEPLAAREHLGTAGFRLLDPFIHPVNFARANERADIGGRFGRVTDLHRLGLPREAIGELFGDALMRKNALHRHTHLSGMIEGALGKGGQGARDIGVLGDDHRGDTAVLQPAACARRQFGAEHPAHAGAADKAEKSDPFVGHQRL